jgi:hypothetical protein
MSITITKAKILKDDKVEISFTRTSTKHKPSSVNEEHRDAPHEDFKKSFADLAVHAAIIAEFIPADEISDISAPEHQQLKNFTVTGITIHGEDEGVNITAMKTLKNGKMMLFNCPLVRYEDNSENAYTFTDDLVDKVEAAKTEAKKYLDGKFAEDAQTEIQFPADEKITHMQILPPEKPLFPGIPNADPDAMQRVKAEPIKKGGKKRVRQTAETPSGIVEE